LLSYNIDFPCATQCFEFFQSQIEELKAQLAERSHPTTGQPFRPPSAAAAAAGTPLTAAPDLDRRSADIPSSAAPHGEDTHRADSPHAAGARPSPAPAAGAGGDDGTSQPSSRWSEEPAGRQRPSTAGAGPDCAGWGPTRESRLWCPTGAGGTGDGRLAGWGAGWGELGPGRHPAEMVIDEVRRLRGEIALALNARHLPADWFAAGGGGDAHHPAAMAAVAAAAAAASASAAAAAAAS
jgi:hypothetical protein